MIDKPVKHRANTKICEGQSTNDICMSTHYTDDPDSQFDPHCIVCLSTNGEQASELQLRNSIYIPPGLPVKLLSTGCKRDPLAVT